MRTLRTADSRVSFDAIDAGNGVVASVLSTPDGDTHRSVTWFHS